MTAHQITGAPARAVSSTDATLREFVTEVARTRHLTMKALAEELGVSRSKLFAGMRDPQSSPWFIAHLARYTGQPAHELASMRGDSGRPHIPQTQLRSMMTSAAARRGVSLSHLIAASGASRTAVFDLMAGRSKGSPATLAALAEAAGLDVVAVAAACGVELNAVGAARLRAGATLTDFASQVGVSREALTAAEAGQVLRTDVSSRIAIALDDEQVSSQLARARQPACPTHTPVGAAIDELCAREALTFGQVARRAGMAHQHLAQVVTGAIRNPGGPVRDRLATVLGMERRAVDELFVGVPAPFARQGRALAARRGRAGMTQAQVADALGVAANALSIWETGAARVPARHARALEAVLGAPERP